MRSVLLLSLAACLPQAHDHTDATDSDTGSTADDPFDAGLIDTLPTGTCERWNAVRQYSSESPWDGGVASCDPGDTTVDARTATLLRVNLYRRMADLPKVRLDATRNRKAQECALILFANNALSHSPPSSWACYTAAGAEAAGMSNISTSPGITSIDGYMADWGNETTLGHRRWILSNGLGPIGTGTTSQHSCLWVLGGTASDSTPWTAWPPPGEFPDEAASMLDQTGWSIQSDSIDLSAASVAVSVGGSPRSVVRAVLQGGAGSASAISWIPDGWSAQRGVTYTVELTGITPTIRYDVEILDCRG